MSVTTRLRWLPAVLLPAAIVLQTGCTSHFPFLSGSQPTATPEPESGQQEELPPWAAMRPEEALEEAPRWMAQGERALARGDSGLADEAMTRAILALQHVALELPEANRPALLDTLEAWTAAWERSFDPVVAELVATEAGVEPLLEAEERPGTLYEELLLDSFLVVLDPTVTEDEILPPIPDADNRRVDRMVEYFTTNDRGRTAMRLWLERAGEMVPRMVPVLRAHGMPEDLVYLSMIESGFRTDARSWARAVGPWQFIYSTARTFGLEMDWWYDERRDPERAAIAASRFLRQLHEHLDDWYLALAAYNCGEGRVWRDIRRNNSRNFWYLRTLPRQTRNYVPTFLAARRIAKDPEAYGFDPPSYVRPAGRDTVVIREPVELRALAEALDVDYGALRRLNPALVQWCTPPNREATEVYLPKGYGEGFDEVFASIPDEKKTSWARHRVRSGETLSEIAANYSTSMRAIMDVKANRLRNPNRLQIGQYLLVPVAPGSVKPQVPTRYASRREPAVPEGRKKVIYRVQTGDTPGFIAEAHGVGLSWLLRWNGLHRGSVIRAGQRLVLYMRESEEVDHAHLAAGRAATLGTVPETEQAPPAAPDVVPSSEREVTYTVQFGDSPWTIAQMFGITPDELMAANGGNGAGALLPGQTITIPLAGRAVAEPLTYRVQRGDTLWDIAARFDVSVRDLKDWNSIANARSLKPGDLIIVYPGGES
jgi:membrane-bound lytic murein transglycosylase D